MKNDIVQNEFERLKEIERKQKERYKKQNEHTNKLYDRLSFTVPKGAKQRIEVKAKENGKTVNAYVSDLVMGSLEETIVKRTEKPVEAPKTDNSRIAQLTEEINRKREAGKQESVLIAEAEKAQTNDTIGRLISSAQENRSNKD